MMKSHGPKFSATKKSRKGSPECGATPSEADDVLSVAAQRKKRRSASEAIAVKEVQKAQKKRLAVKSLKVKKDKESMPTSPGEVVDNQESHVMLLECGAIPCEEDDVLSIAAAAEATAAAAADNPLDREDQRQISNQEPLPMVPLGNESMDNGKGNREPTASISLANGMGSSPSALGSCSTAASSMPSHLVLPQESGHQVVFQKTSNLWPLIEASDVFKEPPQQPHFLPLLEAPPALREGKALGLMVTFTSFVESAMEATVEKSKEWFEEKITTLCHLESNGFNVKFLEEALTKFMEIKANLSNIVSESEKLKARVQVKTVSSSQMEMQLDEKKRAIAELEQKLGTLRQESQKIAHQKETEDAELSSLRLVQSRIEEAKGAHVQEFSSILARLRREPPN